MKTYTFAYDQNGEQITTATFKANNKKEALVYAKLYKRRELKKFYPYVKLNKVSIIGYLNKKD